MNHKPFASTELVSAILSNALSEDQTVEFLSNPKSIASTYLNVDFSNVKINAVENTSTDFHLILPYYSLLDVVRVKELDEDDLDAVSGGEILISAGILGGMFTGAIIATAIGAGVGVSTAGAVIGGIAGGIAVGTIVTAGAVAGSKSDK